MIQQPHHADYCSLPDFDVGLAYFPHSRWNQNHLHNDLTVEAYVRMQTLLVKQKLHQSQHIHAQFIVLIVFDIGGNDLQDVFEPFDQSGVGPSHEQVEDVPFGCVFVPMFV